MRRTRLTNIPTLGALLTLFVLASSARADRPLRERVDALIEAEHEGPLAAPATDAEFLRRITLDLIGRIPNVEEARDFLDDPSPYKRERLIDELLDSPEYARRMQYVFDATLMERRRDQHVPRNDWEAYLRQSFAENKPYDQLVRELLSADGSEPGADRAPAKFTLDRGAEPDLMTRDIGRLFLGIDLQCAQCHDHPLIVDYEQAHYFGIYAFLSRTSLFTDPNTKTVMLAEKADGDVTFVSVFKKSVTHQTGPRILDQPEVEEPELDESQAYRVEPADGVRSIPTYSRFAQLGQALTGAEVDQFDRAAANRLWALLMKRGIFHPLDLDHSDNPPSHPELLDLLALEFRAMGCDVKAFLREIALSQTYQRSSEPPPGASADILEPDRFVVANLEPLSPEQLAWSVMQGLGLRDAVRAQVERRLDVVDLKLRDILATDAKRQEHRRWIIEEGVHARLGGNVRIFLQLFGAGEGQPPDASDSTVQQALFLSNSPTIQNWLAPSGTNLTGRLAKLETPSEVAEELYLSLLSRRPSSAERASVAQFLDPYVEDDRAAAIEDLTWGVLTSSEFRFNH